MRNKMPLVSIIVPCYNSEKTILETLKSISNQTYSNIEIIIINDGSKDNTENIIKEFISTSEKRISYITQCNSGVSVARNTGINNANGEYIMFLDADDLYHYDIIRTFVNISLNENTDCVFGCYTRNAEIINKQKLDDLEYISLDRTGLLNKCLYKKEKIGFFTFLYKKDILKSFNILFSEGISYGEDIEFCWKYIIHCKNAVFVNHSVYAYIDNPESVVNNITWSITDSLKSIIQIQNYIKNIDISFYNKFKSYAYQRQIWTLLKDFAVNKNKDLFYRFINEYKIKKINVKLNEHGSLIFISSLLFNINSAIFYSFIRMLVGSNIYKYLRK